MTLEIKVPVLPESVLEATIAKWHKKIGDHVQQDELIVDIETDKVVLEVTAPHSGVIEKIVQQEGSRVKSQELIGLINEKALASDPVITTSQKAQTDTLSEPLTSPSVRKMLHEHQIALADIQKTLQKNRIEHADIQQYLSHIASQKAPSSQQEDEQKGQAQQRDTTVSSQRQQTREPMSALRQRIAQRLVEAQHTAAMLTTFNEVDMSHIIAIREKHKDSFLKKHQVKLGFMSFFMKAACQSLIKFPLVNASIDGSDIVFRNYCDLGVAVSSERGLVVPVIRDAHTLELAALEKNLAQLAEKARSAKITLEEMTGGSFTITNGGVFGSLLSTPIINPPQTAILGMHKIQERPIALNGQVVIRPMMYLALSYDHRLIDGATAVSFLVSLKNLLEEPERFLLDLA